MLTASRPYITEPVAPITFQQMNFDMNVMPPKTISAVYLVFFFLWLYSPILGLGRLHETFRFISVTKSRTVGRTPWTGDQLVARPLLTAPGDCVMTKLVE
jgi:hypothetical protein